MTPSAERHLHDTDRDAWLRYVAPRLRVKLFQHPSLALAWATLERDTQRAVWALLDDGDRAKVRTARDATGATEPTV